MRLVVFCCVLLGILLALDNTGWQNLRVETRAALAVIRAHSGMDLSKLPEVNMKQLTDCVTRLIPNRDYQEHRVWGFAPERVWFSSDGARPFCLLFETITPPQPHPGTTPIRMTVFDHFGKVVSEQEFTTGHRCYLDKVTFETLPGSDLPLICVSTVEAGLGPNVARQFYAPSNGWYELIRLENEDGKATRNRYYVQHFMCGPDVPRRSETSWLGDLLSADRNRVLRTLVWLGGEHGKGELGDRKDKQYESMEEIDLVRRVRANPRVIRRLKELGGSEDRWLREAAILAAKPADARW